MCDGPPWSSQHPGWVLNPKPRANPLLLAQGILCHLPWSNPQGRQQGSWDRGCFAMVTATGCTGACPRGYYTLTRAKSNMSQLYHYKMMLNVRCVP